MRVFACEEFGTNKAMKNIFVMIERNVTDTLVLWTEKILLLISLKGYAYSSKREYSFLQYMNYARPLDSIDKELVYECFGCNTTHEIDYSNGEDDNAGFSVGELFGLESLSSIQVLSE